MDALAAADIASRLRAGLIWCAGRVDLPVVMDARPIADIASQGDRAAFADAHAAFIKDLRLDEVPSSVMLHIFAFTRYRLYINGSYVGRGPCRFENAMPEYDSWPVAGRLVRGRNVIAILAHRDAPTGRIMAHEPGMAAVIEIDGDTGKTVYASGPDWRAVPERSFGARDLAWASVEEHIDARAMPDWIATNFDAGDWPGAVSVGGEPAQEFVPRSIPLLRETPLRWRGQEVPSLLAAGDSCELHLERIALAYHDLEFEAPEGSELAIQYRLPEGDVSGRATYIARGGRQRFMGGDVFAFDRLSVTVTSGAIRFIRAEAVEVLYPFVQLGRFTSSDDYLNRLWAICARTLELVSEDAYVDCADRERVEWTDETPPAFECTRVMMAGPKPGGGYVYSDPRLLRGLLQRIALTQTAAGQLKAHSCSERWDIHAIMEDRSCDWVIALRQYFDATGDLDFVRSVWGRLVRLIDWFLQRRTERGLVEAREWEVWDNPLRYQVCEGAGLNAFFYQAVSHAAYLGDQLGLDDQSNAFRQAGADLARDFNDHLWDESSGSYFGGLFGPGAKLATQLNDRMFTGPFLPGGRYRPTIQAALFALDSGIVPSDRLDRVVAFVLAHQDDAEAVMTNHFLFRALYALDRPEHDIRVLEIMRRKWRPMVESVWGTCWEGLAEAGSKVHVYGMAPGYFLSAFVLGVRVEGHVRDRLIRIDPRAGDLGFAEGIVVTEFGPVPITWTTSPTGGVTLTAEVPPGCTAMVQLAEQARAGTVRVDGAPAVPDRFERRPCVRLGQGGHRIEYSMGAVSAD